jgi:CBS domain-containing protein
VAFFALTYLWFINVVLAVFNLLPGFPLDGGRVFRAAIWGATGNLRTATRVASITGQVFGWAFIVLGVGSLFVPALALYGNIWFALVGWFLVSAARQSYQQVVMRETLTGVQVGALMTPQVDAVPSGMSVERLVTDYFLRESAWTLPVEHDGKVIGTVSVEDVRNLPRDQWPSLLVGEIVHPLGETEMLEPQETAWTAANRMSATKSDRMLVSDGGGHISGIVTRGAISRWLQAHSKLQPGTA